MSADAPALSRWTGTFLGPAAEAAFQGDVRPRLAAQFRMLAFLPGLYLAASAFDRMTFGAGAAFWRLGALRLCVWLLVALGGLLASRSWTWAQLLLFAGLCLTLGTEVYEFHLLAGTSAASLPQEIPFLVLFILGIYMMLPLDLRLGLLAALAGSALFLGYLAAGAGPSAVGLQALYLLFANGIGLAFRITWERIQRRDFSLRRRLVDEIAERKAAEAEARRAHDAKARFLAVMSHEIRTPLNGVLGGIQLLQARGLDPAQATAMDLLARNGDLLVRLLDDLLDLARIDTGRLSLTLAPFDPAGLLEAVRASLQPQAQAKGLAFRVEAPGPALPSLVGDALRLRQVLLNLAGNAVKFTPTGEVVVALEGCPAPGGAGLLRCRFEVRDTGPGLDREALGRVFQPFEQADMGIQRRHGGVGLGLTISRELVRAMGSELAVESAPGQGCRFRFSLDLPLGAAPRAAPGGPLALLVVDDLEANRIVAAGLLEQGGHTVHCAAGAGEALELLARRPMDAILLDLHLGAGDGDGPDALARLRAHPDPRVAGTPVLIVSADPAGAQERARSDPEVLGVLPKPIHREQLEAMLAGLPAAGNAPPAGPGPIDRAFVAKIRQDLGEAVWAEALAACQTSALACLDDLPDPQRAPGALHRLAGLAASYGMVDLHRLARQSEPLAAGGAPWPRAAVQVACRQGLAGLLEVGRPDPAAWAPRAPERTGAAPAGSGPSSPTRAWSRASST